MDRSPDLRQIHAYCIGAPKTGTHSVAGLFSQHYRSQHEPMIAEMLFYSTLEDLQESDIRAYLRQRDTRLQLDMESNHLLISFVDILVDEFPEAKFLITVRDCYSWLYSMINHHIIFNADYASQDPDSEDIELYDWWDHWYHCKVRHPENDYTNADKILSDYGVFPVKDYLHFWNCFYQKLLYSIPQNRRIILKTDQISSSRSRISEFLDIPHEHLSRTHSYLAKTKYFIDLKDLVKAVYVKECIELCCGELIKQYFPDS